MYAMSSIAIERPGLTQAPKLRLLPKRREATTRVEARQPTLRLLDALGPEAQPVLIAGGDVAARAAVLGDLAGTMPPDTVFEQAGAIWEVLVRAPECSMVILTGELEEIDGQALMQMLVHRSPEVPVVCLDAAEPSALQPWAPVPAVRAVAR
jgi:hypothetical protein